MGKVKKAKKVDKVQLKAAKKEKGEKKSAVKEIKAVKKKGKGKEDAVDEDDLIKTLEEYRERWAAEHKVTEDVVDGPPSRRANATLTPCPVKDHLYLFGGEYFDGSTVEIYADLYRYAPDKNEWRRFTSPTSPGPRSAHQMVPSPAGGGKLWLFGGEYSAPNQSSFHHYRDLWCFDITTHSWERFDTKLRPSARSGHRMALWKHWIFLFGGFSDTGIRTSYLSDLWAWDTNEYRWHQIEISDVERKPGARSGFSFLPCAEGLILHGGYTKVYEGKRVTGMALSDTWLLKVPPMAESGELDFKKFKWERKKKIGYAPSTRSGCTMALWASKNIGVLFGGVCDDDKDEETLESTFYNELFGLNLGSARWISLPLKKKKKAGGGKKRKPKAIEVSSRQVDEDEEMLDHDGSDGGEEDEPQAWELAQQKKEAEKEAEIEDDPDDPEKTVPFARYNAMLAVQRNALYIYGGILEAGSREYTLDDFYTLQLDKLDRFTCLKECKIDAVEWNGSDSGNDDSDSDIEDSGSESGESDSGSAGVGPALPMEDIVLEELQLTDAELAAAEALRAEAEREDLRKRATAFLGVSAATDRSAEDILSTPQPGETLAKFFARSREYWTQKAFASIGAANRGKELRRDGFQLAEEAFQIYQPLLEEIARIQAQAGLDADELSKGGRAGGAGGLGADSRNRR